MPILTYIIHSFIICFFIYLSALPIILWTKKPHILDIFWGIGIATASTSLIKMYATPNSSSYLIIGFVILWAIRLSSFLLYTRVLTPHNDRRYESIIGNSLLKMVFKQCIIQALLQTLIVITLFPLTQTKSFSPLSLMIGCSIFLIGLLFESIADFQLYQFKKNNQGLCNVGLWKYSRHPNYFFECLLWFGISIVFIPSTQFFISLIGPISIFIIVYFITGPLTERASQQKYGIDFKNYSKKTAYFLIWFNK
ncbi:MAG: DUF1295 domain-containing protein [Candidatus Margulisiibacteriota bacterium]